MDFWRHEDPLKLRFGSQGLGRLRDDGRREVEPEIADLEIVERLAVAGELELAGHQAGFLQLLQVQVKQWAADADFAGELADRCGLTKRGAAALESV